MRHMNRVVSVELTRTECVALRETIERSPLFEGRTEVRDAVRDILRGRQLSPLRVDQSVVVALARRIVPIDVPTATIRSKLDRALVESYLAEDTAFADVA